MCDSMVALPDVTERGDIIFGKNSDRPAGEMQDAIFIPARTHTNSASLKCTYIKIPQVERTLAIIISQPRWMWGAEMGANQCGVVIGNEAVWTREPTHSRRRTLVYRPTTSLSTRLPTSLLLSNFISKL